MLNKNYIAILLGLFLAMASAKAQDDADAFPYPSVPDTLRTTDARALYVMEHYWDGFHFADTTYLAHPDATEQGFVNFVDLMPRIAPAAAATGLRAFADHLYAVSGVGDRVREFFAEMAERYLSNQDSPMRNDLLYAQFLDVMATNKFASVAERTRNEYMARNLRKNLPGSVAADFRYVDAGGKSHRMRDFRARYTLLYMYDPDCSHCHEVASQLVQVAQLRPDGPCRVLAVYPYGDTERWRHTEHGFPAHWTDAYSPGGQLMTDDAYYIQSMPSLYLLDADKRVLLKNPSMKLLNETLRGIGD